jgi:GNAT superfamily N-acetyltransferase
LFWVLGFWGFFGKVLSNQHSCTVQNLGTRLVVGQAMKNEEEIAYRRDTLSDVSALVEYRVRFLNELYNHKDNDETKVIRKSLLGYFIQAIPSGDFIAWVAEIGGKIVATSGMVVWRKPAIYGGVESGKLGYLLNFYTIPEARRKGIATRLLNELIKEAELLGLRYLHLHASKDGEPIYRKAGFVEPNQPELTLRLK